MPREEPPLEGDQRAMLVGWLDFHRETLAVKVEDLHLMLAARAVWPLRFWLVKTRNDYARHDGHADIIRELIDGTTGE